MRLRVGVGWGEGLGLRPPWVPAGSGCRCPSDPDFPLVSPSRGNRPPGMLCVTGGHLHGVSAGLGLSRTPR